MLRTNNFNYIYNYKVTLANAIEVRENGFRGTGRWATDFTVTFHHRPNGHVGVTVRSHVYSGYTGGPRGYRYDRFNLSMAEANAAFADMKAFIINNLT